MRRTILLSIGVMFGFTCQAAKAQRTIQVPEDMPTVQGAINVATDGDTVNIALGIYSEVINFNGKSITVQGSGPGTILDGKQIGPVVRFQSGETRSSILQNVTIRNGFARTSPGAGGIFISGASPTIRNSIIDSNEGCAIGSFNSAPSILNNEISSSTLVLYVSGCYTSPNSGEYFGGGILLNGSSPDGSQAEIIGNTIEDNKVGWGGPGINVISAGIPLIKNNVVRNNTTNESGGGIFITGDTAPLIVQNLIYNNTIDPTLAAPAVGDVGAGISVQVTSGLFASASVLIVNNTIVGNRLQLVPGARSQGTQFYADQQMNRIQLFNNLIIGEGVQSAIDCNQSTPMQPVQPPTFLNNDIYNINAGSGGSIFSGVCTNPTGTDGNISTDPQFISNASDVAPYQLAISSPAVDTGNNQAPSLPSLDILGKPRIQNAKGLSNAIVDMGAYEYHGVPSPSPPPGSFSVAANPSTLTLATGSSGSVTITVTPTAENLGTILLGCSGFPSTSSCAFASSAISFSTTAPQTTTLTINTLATPTGSAGVPANDDQSPALICALCIIPAVRRRAKGKRPFIGFGVISAGTLLLSITGCGPDKIYSIAPPQNYQLTINASAVNIGLSKQLSIPLSITSIPLQ